MTWIRRRILVRELKSFSIHTGKQLECLHLCFAHGWCQATTILFPKHNPLFPLYSSYSVEGVHIKEKQKGWKWELVLTERVHDLQISSSYLSYFIGGILLALDICLLAFGLVISVQSPMNGHPHLINQCCQQHPKQVFQRNQEFMIKKNNLLDYRQLKEAIQTIL